MRKRKIKLNFIEQRQKHRHFKNTLNTWLHNTEHWKVKTNQWELLPWLAVYRSHRKIVCTLWTVLGLSEKQSFLPIFTFLRGDNVAVSVIEKLKMCVHRCDKGDIHCKPKTCIARLCARFVLYYRKVEHVRRTWFCHTSHVPKPAVLLIVRYYLYVNILGFRYAPCALQITRE